MSNELVPLSELKEMALVLGRNGLFGKKPEDLLPLMLIAQAEGRHPASVAQDYDIIKGKPAINAKAALARYQASGGKIEWLVRTDNECAAKFSHPASGTVKIEWDASRAKNAGLWGKEGPWRQYPRQMLAARVIAEGVRASFPACLSGFYTVEERQDIEVAPAAPADDPVQAETFPVNEEQDPVEVQYSDAKDRWIAVCLETFEDGTMIFSDEERAGFKAELGKLAKNQECVDRLTTEADRIEAMAADRIAQRTKPADADEGSLF